MHVIHYYWVFVHFSILYSFDYSAETTKESVLKSLQCMKLSYIDLVQIHDVEHAPSLQTLINETIPCLVDLKMSGLIKSIGVTGTFI